MEGHLTKLGGFVRNWKERWVVLDPVARAVTYYKDPANLAKPQGKIEVGSCVVCCVLRAVLGSCAS